MIAFRKKSACLLAAATFGVALLFNAGASAAPATPGDAQQQWAKQRHEWVAKHIEHLGARLEIKASQQGAWQAYAKTVEAVSDTPMKKPEGKDAASLVRWSADLATSRAQKLTQIADATAQLQAVLDPDQRRTLDQAVIHSFHRAHHFHGAHGGHGEHGEHGEHGQHAWHAGEQH